MLERKDLRAVEETAFRLIQGKLLVVLGRPAESPFLQVIRSRGPDRRRAEAYGQMARLRYVRGDYAGAIRFLRELIDSNGDDGELPKSSIMEVEANYRHRISLGISEGYQKMGNGREAHRWALRAKYVWPFISFLGNAEAAAHEWVEDRLCETAPLAGIVYRREPFVGEVRSRRRYGPSGWEGGAGIGGRGAPDPGGRMGALAPPAGSRRNWRAFPDGRAGDDPGASDPAGPPVSGDRWGTLGRILPLGPLGGGPFTAACWGRMAAGLWRRGRVRGT